MTTLSAMQLHEPELEFGDGGVHVDVRRGLALHGPLDCALDSRPTSIRIGMVGTPETTEKCQQWLAGCGEGVAAKRSNQPNLFPSFPGFGAGRQLSTPLSFDARLVRSVQPRRFASIEKLDTQNRMVSTAVDLFAAELQELATKGGIDVMVVAPPMSMLEAVRNAHQHPSETFLDFHDMLKARVIGLNTPLQLILPATYGAGSMKPKRGQKTRKLQDPATIAWNIYVALYYKAGGLPWRLPRISSDLTTCFVGVSFFHDIDQETVSSSVAQVFNERGDGMIIRGGSPIRSKDDRQLYLSSQDAQELVTQSIKVFRDEHKTSPARVVVHKTSPYNDAELEGMEAAVEAAGIEVLDLLHLRSSDTRLFSPGDYPPPRGTFLELDDAHSILYTRGVVPYFDTYPGMYVPRALEIRRASADSPQADIAREILGLSKMNANDTQFDRGLPMTIRAARNVSDILRYVHPSQTIARGYAHYM
ncbi:MAG: hypothetical protein KDC46_16425 [Thermoleophilia bacterium]|nr:hypothetical protein [Thermoleophilia bacterium]